MLGPERIQGPGEAMVAVGLFVICLIAGAFPALRLGAMVMEGAIEPFLAVVGIFLYLVLLFAVLFVPSVIGFVILICVVASAALLPYLTEMAEAAGNVRIEEDKIHRYARALEENPMNHVARLALAEALYKRGELDRAIEHMTWTLQQAPSLAFRITPQLDAWKREKERKGAPTPIFCHQCRAENPQYATMCSECGARFGTLPGVYQRILQEGGLKVLIRTWIVMSATLIAGVFVLVVLFHIPALIAGPILIAMVIVAAWLFLRWVGGDLGVTGE
ncbi:MAG TPA: hypothetical protein VNJ09_03780 [Chthonomonadales bacterium]|nr:hypothetical protein [Chthonomonadales bacterium]